VKFSDKLVIILDESGTETLATHARQAPFKHSILDAHMPPAKLQLETFDIKRVERFASLVGPKTEDYVAWQLELEILHPLRALRRLQGLIRFFDTSKVEKAAMEYASAQALQFKRSQLSFYKGCALAFQATGKTLRLASAPKRQAEHIHVRP
jgi:hypothetical protein